MTIYLDADEAESDIRSDAAVNVMTPIVGKDPTAVAALEPPLGELTDSAKECAGALALFGIPAWEAVRMAVHNREVNCLGGGVQIDDPIPAE